MDKFVHLTGPGWEKAIELSQNWNWRIDRIYTSPLQRCVETILPLSLDKMIEYEVVNELQELDYRGNAQAFHQLVKNNPSFHFVNGESLDAANKRFSDSVFSLSNSNRGKGIVLSTHGTVLSQFLIRRFNLAEDIFSSLQYPDIFRLTIDNDTHTVSDLSNLKIKYGREF